MRQQLKGVQQLRTFRFAYSPTVPFPGSGVRGRLYRASKARVQQCLRCCAYILKLFNIFRHFCAIGCLPLILRGIQRLKIKKVISRPNFRVHCCAISASADANHTETRDDITSTYQMLTQKKQHIGEQHCVLAGRRPLLAGGSLVRLEARYSVGADFLNQFCFVPNRRTCR